MNLLTTEEQLLFKALDFTPEDLEANRQGKLGPRQIARLQQILQRRLAGVMLALVMIVLLAATVPLFLGSRDFRGSESLVLFPVILIPVLAFLSFRPLRSIPELRQVLRQGNIRKLEAIIRKGEPSAEVGGRFNTVQNVEYAIHVDGQRLPVTPKFWAALEDESSYVLYFVDLHRRQPISNANILACERSQDYRQRLNAQPAKVMPRSAPFKMPQFQRQNEAFISYSRVNLDFARGLVESLEAGGLDCWFDMEDIPGTAVWWQQIKSGIREANAVVCIISPNWLRSEVSHWEMDYALTHSKKIIPLFYQDVFQDHDLLQSLADLNWQTPDGRAVSALANWDRIKALNFILAHQGQPDVVQEVITAARIDLAYVEQHTRLLQRAHEWAAVGQRADFLLKGVELEAALKWLQQGAYKTPAPDDLHQSYIQISREIEQERLKQEQERERRASRNEQTAKSSKEHAQGIAKQLAVSEARRKDVEGKRPLTMIAMALFGIGSIAYLIAQFGGLLSTSATPRYQLPSFPPALLTGEVLRLTTEPTPGSRTAVLGDNGGRLIDGKQSWLYDADQPGENLHIQILATWQAIIELTSPDGAPLSPLEESSNRAVFTLPSAGRYHLSIHRRAEPQGIYILSLTR